MRAVVKRPVFDRDEFYESTSSMVRWIVLGLVVVTYPFTTPDSIVVLTLVTFTAAYNALRYNKRLRRTDLFKSHVNTIGIDHIFVLALLMFSGGLASPYYPLLYLLILGTIAAYGIAGFAFSLGTQAVMTLILLSVKLNPLPATPEFQFIIKLILLIVFSLVAEQTVRNRDEEYLLEGKFTTRLDNERQRLLALINSLGDAVLAIDAKGKVYLYNAAALELLNTNRSVAGMGIDDLLPLFDHNGRSVSLFQLITAQERAISRQDLQYKADDGSAMILDLTVAPVHIYSTRGGTGGYMAVFRDITKKKSLDEQRDEFVSVTSHELRTPLAIAEANLSTALLPGYAKIDDKAKIMMEQAHKNIVFLSELIEDLTTLSRAERGDLKLKLELIEAATLAEELVRDYRPQAEAKHLQLRIELDPHLGNILTSRTELREILQNFLTNAIKYTAAGNVTLAVSVVKNGTDFTVHDTGIGVSASDKPKLFGKFYRSEDYRTRQTGGTGLGLYITHKLAEKLGVTISFTSKLNHGSAFNVHVPLATGKAASDAIAYAAAPEIS